MKTKVSKYQKGDEVFNTKLPDYSGITVGDWLLKKEFTNEHDWIITDNRINDEKTQPICSVFGKHTNYEAEANAVAIASLPNLIKENEELKKGIKYAEKVAFDNIYINTDLMVKCETYKKDYDSMVKEVLKLSRQKSELLEALKSTRSLNLSLYEQDTVGNRVYKKVESAITKATK